MYMYHGVKQNLDEDIMDYRKPPPRYRSNENLNKSFWYAHMHHKEESQQEIRIK